MKQADQAASVPDSLFVPYDRLVRTGAAVVLLALVFFQPRLLVNLADGEYEQQGMGWPWNAVSAVASLLSDFQGFQLVMNFVVMPVFFLSGALFPLQGLPRTLDIIARLDPLTYGVDGLRGALIQISYFGAMTDLGILSLVAAGMVVLGGYLFSRIQL